MEALHIALIIVLIIVLYYWFIKENAENAPASAADAASTAGSQASTQAGQQAGSQAGSQTGSQAVTVEKGKSQQVAKEKSELSWYKPNYVYDYTVPFMLISSNNAGVRGRYFFSITGNNAGKLGEITVPSLFPETHFSFVNVPWSKLKSFEKLAMSEFTTKNIQKFPPDWYRYTHKYNNKPVMIAQSKEDLKLYMIVITDTGISKSEFTTAVALTWFDQKPSFIERVLGADKLPKLSNEILNTITNNMPMMPRDGTNKITAAYGLFDLLSSNKLY